jgi:hypothetical protein
MKIQESAGFKPHFHMKYSEPLFIQNVKLIRIDIFRWCIVLSMIQNR